MLTAIKIFGFGAGQMAFNTMMFLILYLVFIPITMDLLVMVWLRQQYSGGERRWRNAFDRRSGLVERRPG